MTMREPAFTDATEPGARVLAISGDWTVYTVDKVDAALRALAPGEAPVWLDVSQLGQIDTAGAHVLDRTLRALAPARPAGVKDSADDSADDRADDRADDGVQPLPLRGDHASAAALIAQVRRAWEAPDGTDARPPYMSVFERTGRGVAQLWRETLATLAFLGETLATTLGLLLRPHRIRWTATVAVMEEAGLDALPIIAFLSFFVGMVVAFIGATVLGDFGAEIFTVELVGFAMLREFGAVISAIILAGRTNSAFTAQIGAMRMRQEVDAMTTLGLGVQEVLVAPRVFAMVVVTPILSFIATLAGLGGGVFVGWATLDIPPAVFLARLQDYVPIENFWVGLSKAPIFGFVLALLACRQGLLVGGSVQSLGDHTTTSVVQAIFSVIVIDAVFAVFYMELGI